MAHNLQLIVYPVQDVEKAKKFYTEFLGVEPYTDSPYYIGYRVGDIEVGLDPNSPLGPIVYIDVEDINSSVQAIVDAGGEVVQEPQDVGGGLTIAKLKDVDGNVVGLRHSS